MIIEVKEMLVVRTSPRAKKMKRVIVYRCDQCHRVYEGKYQKKYLTNRRFHLCSYECVGRSRAMGGVACEFQLGTRDIDLWQSRVKETLQERYGVDNASSLEWVKQKKIATTRAHYGVDNPQQDPEIKRRSVETHALRSGNVWMSKPEKAFRVALEGRFGKNDVKIQRLLERRWSVDFYVTSIDTYVQFDGIYWHGLNRPPEVIKASNGKRDQAIYGKWLKDRELDAYVVEHGLRLIRVTDQEFESDPTTCLLKVERYGTPLHHTA